MHNDIQDSRLPLHFAISGNREDIVKLLIEKYKASPTDCTDVRHYTANAEIMFDVQQNVCVYYLLQTEVTPVHS